MGQAPVKYAAPMLNTLRCHLHEFNLASCHYREFNGVNVQGLPAIFFIGRPSGGLAGF